MPKRFSPLWLPFLVLATTGAGVYKWVDEQGVTHYSASSPPGGKARQMKTAPPPSQEAAKAAQEKLQKLLEQQKQREAVGKEEKDAEKQRQAAGQREEEEMINRCRTAQDQLDLLQVGRPVFKVDEKGERQFWEDKDRPAETARLKKEIAKCSVSKDKLQAAEEEGFWRDACRYLEAVRKNADGTQPTIRMTASEIVKLKAAEKSYCSATWRGRGAQTHSAADQQSACHVLKGISRDIMRQGSVSTGELSFSNSIDVYCGP
jgi:hypothetical protein